MTGLQAETLMEPVLQILAEVLPLQVGSARKDLGTS